MNWRAFISGVLITSLVLFFGFSGTPKIVSAANQVVIYLESFAGLGNQTFNVPLDWNSSTNTIECIGSGGKGTASTGGGGGAYAKISSLSLTGGGTATYAIGASATTTANTGMWRETYFNDTASSSASISCAFGRSGGSGGAAGPNGAGGNGFVGTGGTGDNGFGGIGGASANAGAEESCEGGFPGTEYSNGPADTVGSGGGGGGGVVGIPAGCSGGYWGAGGGGGNPVGTGIQGIIIIYYTPSTSGFTGILAKFKIQGGRVLIRGGRVLFR
jgi:hypothetical protein